MNSSLLAWHFAQNAAADEADIDIFDVIGGDMWDGGGIKAADFVKELRGITAKRINVHINSPGGYVTDGLAIYNALRLHDAEIIALIESQAASAASFVAMAADKIKIAPSAKIFIHDAQGFGLGNAADMAALAALLEEESDNIAGIYAEKAGEDVAFWREAMRANDGIGTSYRGQEAVDIGLADELIDMPKRRNLHQFRIAALLNAGRTMSQRNLDALHSAMDGLSAVHSGTCDMADCPMATVHDSAPALILDTIPERTSTQLTDSLIAAIVGGMREARTEVLQ